MWKIETPMFGTGMWQTKSIPGRAFSQTWELVKDPLEQGYNSSAPLVDRNQISG